MTPRRKKRLLVVVSIVFGLGVTTGLILYALNQNMDLFYTPSEIIAGKEDGSKPHSGQRLRVGGMVVKGSVRRAPDSLKVSFQLKDFGESITVNYDGILPDLFREGQGIVAQGTLTGPRTVEAFEVLAKHDENYMPPEVSEAMDKNHAAALDRRLEETMQ
ncbi:cytochrome c maturation protein CcmE [Vibrio mangrovi]|uniref:Cytochrome c-type biogenesis protein CcmE n=1 Tax=Vibrio mangrovi TaxID=474394 RepID=A0A1Y6ISB0_9VIBR|nr:cytochrome c maturation protein CcmE [Vibrio mangrovi]MDW6001443.1 cytochrome c maturation protein CcmE [Vibrio mangrovi]SMS00535.1 Cytochrome c-type biogenesis protein CcmE [Vibrio mangrovi]